MIAPHSALVPAPSLRFSARVFTLMLGLGVVAASPALSQAQKFQLVYKAQAGQVKRLASVGAISGDLGDPSGRKHVAEFRQTEKITFTKVAPTGEITIEDVTESSEATIDGAKMPENPDEKKDTDTATFKADGSLTAFQTTDDDKDAARRSARLFPSTQPIFPAGQVGVGDKWVHDYAADDTIGTRAAHSEFELLAIEDKGGVSCAKIKMTYVETSGSTPLSVKGTVWVDRATGDKVNAEFDLVNMPLGDDATVVAGTLREARQSGGPLPGTPAPKPGDAVPAAPPTPPRNEPKKIDEVTKDFEKLPGVLTLYRKKDPTGRETIYAELREDQLDKLILLQATASTGTTDQIEAGEPINDMVFQFSKSGDDRLFLTVPNWSRLAPAGSPTERAIKRSYPDAYLQTFRIEARQPERKTLLIDVSDFFKGDLMGISQVFMGSPLPGLIPSPPGGPMVMDREKTMVMGIKNFPENLTVNTLYHFARGSLRQAPDTALADPRSAPLLVTFNLSMLPVGNGYRPRLADPRIGYFANDTYGAPVTQSFAKEDSDDLSVRYIHRWDLRKKDPAATLSEPVQPIVFWLDNAIPTEWRPAIRDGLLTWNRAFERIGFKNVIQVKQMPDNPDPKDATVPAEIGDQRFNIVRWVAADDMDEAHAIAHARFNPLTGQVLSGSITITSTFARITKLERKNFVEPAQLFARVADYDPARALKSNSSSAIRCELAEGLSTSAWMGFEALRTLAPLNSVSEKEYVSQFLKDAIAHECGHLLGLRHNFIASSALTPTQLGDPNAISRYGLSASVMDYTPFNLEALTKKGVPYFTNTLGSYDLWAIEYGYSPIANAPTPDDERPTLSQIARKSGAPGLAYQGDEAADSFDPRITRFDLSSDPLAYWEKLLKTSDAMLLKLDTRAPRVGESYWEFTKSFGSLLGAYAQSTAEISRYVGAQTISRNHRGDVGERPVLLPMDATQQKRALGLLNRYLFAPGALQFPSRYYQKLTTRPDAFPALPGEFPIGDSLANLQKSALRRIFAGQTLSRIANNEFKMGDAAAASALTLPYLFRTVSDNIWSETATGKSVGTQRRQLQRQHLDLMIDLAVRGGGPDDARMLAWAQLKQVKARLVAAQKTPKLTEYTTLHYADSLGKINRALNVSLTTGGSSGLPAGLIQMLSGGQTAPDRSGE